MPTSFPQSGHAAQCSRPVISDALSSISSRPSNDQRRISPRFRRLPSFPAGLPPLPPRSRLLERLDACRISSVGSTGSTGLTKTRSLSSRGNTAKDSQLDNPSDSLERQHYQRRESYSHVSRTVQCRAGQGRHRRTPSQLPATSPLSTGSNSLSPSSNPFNFPRQHPYPLSRRREPPAQRHNNENRERRERREQWRTRLAWWDNLLGRQPPEPPPGWPGVPEKPPAGSSGDARRRSSRGDGEPGTRRGGGGGPGGGEAGTRRGGGEAGTRGGGGEAGTRRGGGETGTRRGGVGGGEAGRRGRSDNTASGGGNVFSPGFKGTGSSPGFKGTNSGRGSDSGSVFGRGFGQTGPGSGSGSGEPGAPLPRWQQRQLVGGPEDDIDGLLADPARFDRWQTSRDLRGIQIDGQDPDDNEWEDWLDDPSEYDYKTGGWYEPQPDWEKGGMPREAPGIPERGMSRSFKELLLRIFQPQDEVEESLTFEERVFRYTSQTTAKFVIFLIAVPWVSSWVLHDYVLTPFMHHYTRSTPLVARMLDLREAQKLDMIERLKLERQRIRFEADIGKAPPLSEDGLAAYLQEEAREMREEIRHENEAAFAYIFSDTVGWLIFAFILYTNPSQVGIMKLTGDRIFTNISDTGKAFVIILCSDIFLGYHSESGWETVVEMFLDHYGLVADQNSIYIFVAIVPVTIDSFFKLWVFKYLVRLSPSAAATFREMKRH